MKNKLYPSNRYTVEPQLSKHTGRHTIGSEKQGVCIGEIESCLAEIWASVVDNQRILGFSRKMGMRHYITV